MAQDQENMLNDGLEQKLASVLSDPESLSRLAGMASALASSGLLSGLGGGSSGDAVRETAESEPIETAGGEQGDAGRADTVPAVQKPSVHGISGRHAALLHAIKPYLGQEKQARVDQMMKLLKLAELADTVLRGM